MKNYAKHVSTQKTPQTEQIPGKKQVKNSAGGYVFQIDDWSQLDRFLILGSDGGTYYTSERKLTIENAEIISRCLAEDGVRTVSKIVEISVSGRAPKNDPAIFALAMAAGLGNDVTRQEALKEMPRVCRIGTHLFQFIEMVQEFRGWGKGLRKAVAGWYLDKEPDKLEYQLVKYRQRNNWTHRDALRLAHANPAQAVNRTAMVPLLKWAAGKATGENAMTEKFPLIYAYEELLRTKPTAVKSIVKIITANPNLPWEAIPTEALGEVKVWEALLPNMLIGALVRNLGRMTANGLLTQMGDATKIVVQKLADVEAITKGRLHPIQVLAALRTYATGHGAKGKLAWNPVQKVVDALDEAFYTSFKTVKPTGKRWLLGLDVSGSMGSGEIAGVAGMVPRDVSAAMSMVTARVEKDYEIMGFRDDFVDLKISPRQRLDTVLEKVHHSDFGTTDCAQPMIYALENKIKFDMFVIYTDNETYAGDIHPVQALKKYRDKMGIDAKLVVVGVTSTGFSIADPKDKGMLDVVGFDTATPNLMADFATR